MRKRQEKKSLAQTPQIEQNPKDKDLVDHWTSQINLGLKYRKDFSDIQDWRKWRDWYRGNFEDEKSLSSYPKVVVNRIFSIIKSMIPKVYFRSPGAVVTARRPEFAPHARVVEALDNWLIQETNLKYVLRSAILQAALAGIGPIKLGFDSQFGYISEQALDQNKATVTQVGQESGDAIEYDINVQPGMPWCASTLPEEIITPYGYRKPNELPWICHAYLRPLEDCKEDQKYDPKYRKQLKGGFTCPGDNLKPWNHLKNIDQANFCLIYEIRDLKTKKMIVISEGWLMMEIDDTLQVDSLPWEFIIFNEDPERFWPIPDVKVLAPQQLELNEIRYQASKMRKANFLKFLFLKKSISPEMLEKLTSDDPDEILSAIEVTGDSIQASIQTMQPHNLTDGLIREQRQTADDMKDTIGYSQNQEGNFAPKQNTTATEVEAVQQASGIRDDERRDIVADVLSNILRKFNQYVFMFWDIERVMEIVGQDGQTYWISYTGQQLRGEYNVVVSPEQGMPVSRELRHRIASEMFGNLKDNPFIDQIGLLRLYLQQTDLIAPEYQNLVRVPPEMQSMMPGPNSPTNINTIMQDPRMMENLFGMGSKMKSNQPANGGGQSGVA